MTRTLTALLAAATVAVTLTAASGDAFAQRRGAAVAAGVLGGLAAGAIIGGAIAGGPPAYAAPPPAYYAPPPAYYGPVCHIERQRYWDGYAWRVQRVEVCD
ncbi:MAG: hypothetical protein HY056_18420 [Proteobacteria bacterium]|nr:hypothetical protein [Pseudomonadota bacterium]